VPEGGAHRTGLSLPVVPMILHAGLILRALVLDGKRLDVLRVSIVSRRRSTEAVSCPVIAVRQPLDQI
jgi:hypothetical protein